MPLIPFEDPKKELAFQGVFRLSVDGTLTFIEDVVKAANGIAFSPDQKTLYLTDVDPDRLAWLAYDVRREGAVANGRVFFDAMRWKGKWRGAPNGIKVDREGNLYGAGPEGVYVFAPDGTHIGTIFTGVPTGNLA